MSNKHFMCGKVEAELEQNIDGSITINKILKSKKHYKKLRRKV